MAVSAIYGTARYGQSRYNQLVAEGSANLVLASTAKISSEARISGTSSLSFVTTGTVYAPAVASGSTSLSIGTTGSILGELLGSGSSTILLSATGTIHAAPTEIKGSSSLAFNDTVRPQGIGYGIGQSGLVLDQSVRILGQAISRGVTSLSFVSSGVAYASVKASGSTDLLFIPTGSIQSYGLLRGLSPLVFSEQGRLTGSGIGRGDALFEFSDEVGIQGGRTSQTDLVFDTDVNIHPSTTGHSVLVFGSTADIESGAVAKGETGLSFNESGKIYGLGFARGYSPVIFGNDATIQGGRSGKTEMLIDGSLSLHLSAFGQTNLLFDGQGKLSFPPSLIKGDAQLVFSSQVIPTLIAHQIGSSSLIFTPSGRMEAFGVVTGQVGLEFKLVKALMNVSKMKSFKEMIFETRSKLDYTNKNPFYPNWGGDHETVNTQTDPNVGYSDLLLDRTSGSNGDVNLQTDSNVGYFGLLLDRTSGNTQPPYTETME